MRFLIVEDEPTSQQILFEILKSYGDCDLAGDGDGAIDLFNKALDEKKPYDLICMDIMMPGLDGQKTLQEIRMIEKEHGLRGAQKVRVLMTTALEDQKNVIEAFYKGGAAGYLVKPIDKQKLLNEMTKLGII